jgi:hypothetical protein
MCRAALRHINDRRRRTFVQMVMKKDSVKNKESTVCVQEDGGEGGGERVVLVAI